MAAEAGFKKPNNGTTQGGSLGAELLQLGANATAANCKPGIVVMRDTNDYSVKESDGSGNDVGFLAYENCPAEFRPKSINTAYAAGAFCGVDTGAGRRQMAYLTPGQNVVKGQPLRQFQAGP